MQEMNEINKKDLKDLLDNDKVFSLIDDDFKVKMLEAFPEGKTLDTEYVEGQRVGHDFLMYLIKDKKIKAVEDNYNMLLKFLIILALLNKRKFIVQCDLMLLTKIKMDALGATGWEDLINKEVKNTMFRKFIIPLDRNGDLKEEMGVKLDNGTLTHADVEEAKKQRAWLDLVIPQIEANIPVALKTDQLQNIFYQDEITSRFKTYCDDLLRWMKYQRLAFNIIANKEI